jgi:S1-C subfamily serine protease
MHMRHMIKVCLMLAMLAGCANGWVGIDRKLNPSLKRIVAEQNGKRQAICTASVLNKKQGFLLTAGHCVDDPTVQLSIDGIAAHVVVADQRLDLAILQAPGIEGNEIRLADSLDVGEPIAIVGFPAGSFGIKYFFGYVSSNGDTSDVNGTLFDVTVTAGDSGGLIVNQSGRVVGVTQGFISDRKHPIFAYGSWLGQTRAFVKPYLP